MHYAGQVSEANSMGVFGAVAATRLAGRSFACAQDDQALVEPHSVSLRWCRSARDPSVGFVPVALDSGQRALGGESYAPAHAGPIGNSNSTNDAGFMVML